MGLSIETLLILTASLCISAYIIISLLRKAAHAILPIAGLAFLALWIAGRSVTAMHAPFSGIYESLLFFSFLYVLKVAVLSVFPGPVKAYLLIPAVIMMIAGLVLPPEMKIANAVPMVLKSFWIWLHVPGIFIGYVSLLAGFVLTLASNMGLSNLEEYIGSEMKLAYFFTAFGIITGGFWAQLSWGSFWSWDPKETWALFTWAWLILERHCKKPALRSAVIYAAMLSMLFNYFGVTFLLQGLHSYR